jgi:hypothetical protein
MSGDVISRDELIAGYAPSAAQIVSAVLAANGTATETEQAS